MYKQKGIGLARHSIKLVFQFRGSANITQENKTNITSNKRSLILSMKVKLL